jgi:peptidoglycan/LPS O-acetylase OafA/YrhL
MDPDREGPLKRSNIAPLTGLRIAAAMLVVVHHFPVPGASGTLLNMMQSGYFGVTLFFVLSGFVLCYNYLDDFAATPGRTLGFYLVARFARIYPVYAFALLFVWLTSGATGDVASHALLLQAWNADVNEAMRFNGPGWSVSVEAFLYLCFPALILLFRFTGLFRSGRRQAAASVIVSLVMIGSAAYFFTMTTHGEWPLRDPASAHRWLYRTPVSRLGDFTLGILCAAFLLRFYGVLRQRQRLWSGLIVASIAAILVLMASPSFLDSPFSWDVGYAIPCVLLIVGLSFAPSTLIGRFFGSPLMVLLGESSYCLYLLHIPLRSLIHGGDTLSLPGQLALYSSFVLLLLATSYGMHLLVERPTQRLIRRTYQRLVGPQRPATEARRA